MTKIIVFPGQGSQKLGMGSDLFERFPAQMEEADAILGYSIRQLCLEDPNQALNRTEFTQPALYVVNALAFRAESENSAPPDRVAGHSLGEYNALLAAGVFDFATGLKLVQERGRLMSGASGGGMAAVVGLERTRVEEILRSPGLDAIDLANVNSPSQIVISGPRDRIEEARGAFEAAGARYLPLNVSGAFHSRYMSEAAAAFGQFLEPFSFQAPRIPVIANWTAQPYQADEIRTNLARQINHSVLWVDTIEALLREPDPDFKEIGPGNVLTGLINRIRKTQKPA